jgi:hypothetical protein
MMWEEARELYNSDNEFRRIVDVMYVGIMNMDYTPSELRGAAMFASMKFEMERSKPRFILKEDMQ